MNNLNYIIIIISLVVLNACEKDDNCIRGNGYIVSRSYNISDFNKLAVYGNTKVYIAKDETSLRIEGEENILSILDVKVKNEELIIGENNCFKDIEPLKIYLSTNALNSIYSAGLCDVYTRNKFISSTFNIEISGTSNMELNIEAQEFNTTISGIGNIIAQGKATTQSISISGTGNLKYFDLETINSDINIDGKGDVELNVSTSLKVKIRGSGNIYYKGSPTIDKDISGSGNIIKAD